MERNVIGVQRAAYAEIARLLDGVPEEVLRKAPSPGKWSVCQILAHLAEDELASSWRYRQMIEHDGIHLEGFDQNLWERLGGYENWDPREALEMFRLLREANIKMLARLTPAEWQRQGVHAERGSISVEVLAHHMANHDQNHIGQIRRILAAS